MVIIYIRDVSTLFKGFIGCLVDSERDGDGINHLNLSIRARVHAWTDHAVTSQPLHGPFTFPAKEGCHSIPPFQPSSHQWRNACISASPSVENCRHYAIGLLNNPPRRSFPRRIGGVIRLGNESLSAAEHFCETQLKWRGGCITPINHHCKSSWGMSKAIRIRGVTHRLFTSGPRSFSAYESRVGIRLENVGVPPEPGYSGMQLTLYTFGSTL
jgi:hypothetical protein